MRERVAEEIGITSTIQLLSFPNTIAKLNSLLQHAIKPLMWAAVAEDINITKLLIQRNANVNACNKVSGARVRVNKMKNSVGGRCLR